MDTSQKILLMGIGFIVGAALLIVGIALRIFSDKHRAKRLWVIIIPGLVLGLTLISIGLIMDNLN